VLDMLCAVIVHVYTDKGELYSTWN
jgi:hypothetical protein